MKARLTTILTIAACIFAGCESEDNFDRRGDWGGHGGGRDDKPTTQKFEVNRNWTLSYDGRETKRYDDGSLAEVDIITMKSTDKELYYIDVITENEMQSSFGGNEADYFNSLAQNLSSDVKNGDKTWSALLESGNSYVDFDRMRAGAWRAYAVGFESNGRLSGYYARLDFNIKEEVPTEEFNKWLGTWKIGGKDLEGNGVSYTIALSSSESNRAYWLRGWEGAKDPDGYDYEFEVEFDRVTGQIVFNSLYFETVKLDDNKDYEVCLNGNIKKGSEYLYINEDIAIAEGTLDGSDTERTATVTGCGVNVNFDNGTTFETVFRSMQMMYVPVDPSGITRVFNEDVPQFPLTMEWLSSSVKSDSAPAARSVARKARRFNPSRNATKVRRNRMMVSNE